MIHSFGKGMTTVKFDILEWTRTSQKQSKSSKSNTYIPLILSHAKSAFLYLAVSTPKLIFLMMAIARMKTRYCCLHIETEVFHTTARYLTRYTTAYLVPSSNRRYSPGPQGLLGRCYTLTPWICLSYDNQCTQNSNYQVAEAVQIPGAETEGHCLILRESCTTEYFD